MPELPEVETIRRGLEKFLVGKVIKEIDVRLPKIFIGDPTLIQNAKVITIRRRGKGLIIDLDNDMSLAIHVKMTGQLIYQGAGVPLGSIPHQRKVGKLPGIHTHVVFTLSKGNSLFYNDIRQFGWVKLMPTKDIEELDFFKHLGPEPLRSLSLSMFRTLLQTKAPIKPLLMDQKKIAGIGNIYANDALFLAKIHPKRPSNSLTDKESSLLLAMIEKVLKKGIDVGGASEWQYVNVLGETGGYQNFFMVYGKDGAPCSLCGASILRITMAGRGTFYCPVCQQELQNLR